MNEKTTAVGTKIPTTTAVQLRKVLEHYHRTFAGQLRVWVERDHRRIFKEAK